MLVSVIVPVYNTKKYVEKCLNSILDQSHKEIELIVINDCSPDGVESILEKYEQKDGRVKVFNLEKNKGLSNARNYGVKQATGMYITFVDSDDYIEKNMIKKMVDKLKKTNCNIVKCRQFTMVENGKKREFGILITDDIVKSYIISIPMVQAQLISKMLLQKIPFPDKNIFYEDLATIPSFVLESNKIEFLEDSSYNYIQRAGSIMRQDDFNENLLDIFTSLNILTNKFRKYEKEEIYKLELEYLHIQHLLYRASLRFLKYDNYKENLKKVNESMLKLYPKWYNNIYYKKQMTFKKRIFCLLIHHKKYKLAKYIMRSRIYE